MDALERLELIGAGVGAARRHHRVLVPQQQAADPVEVGDLARPAAQLGELRGSALIGPPGVDVVEQRVGSASVEVLGEIARGLLARAAAERHVERDQARAGVGGRVAAAESSVPAAGAAEPFECAAAGAAGPAGRAATGGSGGSGVGRATGSADRPARAAAARGRRDLGLQLREALGEPLAARAQRVQQPAELALELVELGEHPAAAAWTRATWSDASSPPARASRRRCARRPRGSGGPARTCSAAASRAGAWTRARSNSSATRRRCSSTAAGS